MTTLYAHYYVVVPGPVERFGEVYVKVYDLDDNHARVLSGARIVHADDTGGDGASFEFLALVREEDLLPGIQVQNHVTCVLETGR